MHICAICKTLYGKKIAVSHDLDCWVSMKVVTNRIVPDKKWESIKIDESCFKIKWERESCDSDQLSFPVWSGLEKTKLKEQNFKS